eukprot:12940392-Alexandrium_andersonii.AAC.1
MRNDAAGRCWQFALIVQAYVLKDTCSGARAPAGGLDKAEGHAQTEAGRLSRAGLDLRTSNAALHNALQNAVLSQVRTWCSGVPNFQSAVFRRFGSPEHSPTVKPHCVRRRPLPCRRRTREQ